MPTKNYLVTINSKQQQVQADTLEGLILICKALESLNQVTQADLDKYQVKDDTLQAVKVQ